MSDTTFETKWVHTRKTHRCQLCWAPIPVGEEAHYWKGVFDGEFQTSYLHRECHDDWDGEEFTPGDAPVPDRIRKLYAVVLR